MSYAQTRVLLLLRWHMFFFCGDSDLKNLTCAKTHEIVQRVEISLYILRLKAGSYCASNINFCIHRA